MKGIVVSTQNVTVQVNLPPSHFLLLLLFSASGILYSADVSANETVTIWTIWLHMLTPILSTRALSHDELKKQNPRDLTPVASPTINLCYRRLENQGCHSLKFFGDSSWMPSYSFSETLKEHPNYLNKEKKTAVVSPAFAMSVAWDSSVDNTGYKLNQVSHCSEISLAIPKKHFVKLR